MEAYVGAIPEDPLPASQHPTTLHVEQTGADTHTHTHSFYSDDFHFSITLSY